MTTNEVVRLEKLVADLRDRLDTNYPIQERVDLVLLHKIEELESQIKGLTRRYEHHFHGHSVDDLNKMIGEGCFNYVTGKEE